MIDVKLDPNSKVLIKDIRTVCDEILLKHVGTVINEELMKSLIRELRVKITPILVEHQENPSFSLTARGISTDSPSLTVNVMPKAKADKLVLTD